MNLVHLQQSHRREASHTLLARLIVHAARLKRASKPEVRVFLTVNGIDMISWGET